jgi:hypothetical protein
MIKLLYYICILSMITSETNNIAGSKLYDLTYYIDKRISALQSLNKVFTIDTLEGQEYVIDQTILMIDVINILPILIDVKTVIHDFKSIDNTDQEVLKQVTDYLIQGLYLFSLKQSQNKSSHNSNIYNYLEYQKYQVYMTLLHCYIKG